MSSKRFEKTVYGVGFLGVGKYKSKSKDLKTGKYKITKEYRIWEGMLMRCYSEKYLSKYPSYRDCSVDPSWHNFQTFSSEIKEIANYDKWSRSFLVDKRNKYCLDKDSIMKGNKIYSKKTCSFITVKENTSSENRKVRTTGKKYVAFDSTGKKYTFSNQAEFCKIHNLNKGNVGQCISGNLSQTKGFTFHIL